MTVGIDLGDKYSFLCLVDTESGEVIEEGRLRTTPEALRRRFASEQQPPMRIAIEARTAESLARLARVDPKLLYPLKHRGEDSQAPPGLDPLA